MEIDNAFSADDEDVVEEFVYRFGKDAVLFCIDASPSMLEVAMSDDLMQTQSDVRTNCPAWRALEAAYITLQQRIISQPNDAAGIMLFGTKQQTDPAYEGCYLLMDLGIPDAADIKRIKDILEDDDEFDKVFQRSSSRTSISTMFFFAGQQFISKSSKYMFRRLFLITNEDNPHENHPDLCKSASTRAQDLMEIGVTIETFFLSSPSKPFDTSKFYEDVIFGAYHLANGDVDSDLKTISSIEVMQIKSHVKSKQIPRHSQFSIPLEIVPGKLSIGVKGYVLLKRQEIIKSGYVYNDGNAPSLVKSHSELIKKVLQTSKGRSDVAATSKAPEKISPEEAQRGYKFGGSVIPFTVEELHEMRNIGKPGIRIIGFKPLIMLDTSMNVKAPSFIYPSEEDYVGSIRTFAALHSSLLSQEKFAVAWMKTTETASPAMCALVACPEKIENGEQQQAPGIYVIKLPFADDVRDFPQPYNARTEDQKLLDLATNVVSEVRLPRYNSSQYPNPALQWHYRVLQALALEEELPESPEDYTLPKYSVIQRRVGKQMRDWVNGVSET